MNDENKTKDKEFIPAYCTLALADPDRVDKKINATSPSLAAVEKTRNWSIENKL